MKSPDRMIAKKFLDNLTKWLALPVAERPDSELREALEAEGIDTRGILVVAVNLLRKKGIEQPWMKEYDAPEADDWHEHPRAWQPDSQQTEAVDEDVVPF